ncbi:MAG: GNAT family N-acetyltransferase [Scrofimicrobium sp.]
MKSTILRPLVVAEAELLELATLGNMNWCGERLTIEDIQEKSEFAHYTKLAPERGDFGIVAELNGQRVGVCWAVFLAQSDAGYGYIDQETPEISLWVDKGHCGRGLGRKLLEGLITEASRRGLAQVSLSVEPDNFAKSLYASEGFQEVHGREADGVMLLHLKESQTGR